MPAAAYENPILLPGPVEVAGARGLHLKLRSEGDSVGAKVTVIASGVPVGLGEPVFDRLDAISRTPKMSNQRRKVGGDRRRRGCCGAACSEHRDELTPQGFASNHSGGVLGGISTGQDVIVHIALKPTSSIQVPAHTIDLPAIRST